MTMTGRVVPSLAVLLLAGGCAVGASETGREAPIVAPHAVALSAYAARVGTLLEVYGTDFPEPDVGETTLVFRGTFIADDGSRHPVDSELRARRVDNGTLRWTTFGPYRVPFGPGNQTGTFDGTVGARVNLAGGGIVDDPSPTPITFTVLPSILVHELQPVTASCGGPVLRAIGGAPYRMRVEAIGFEPTTFTYRLAYPQLRDLEPIAIRHVATGRLDTVGERNDFVLPQVPDSALAYGAILQVAATDAAGESYATQFAIGVHRPLEVYYNGNTEIAELLAPTPVSGCIPGGEAGRQVSYTESESETRTRSYNVSWNESWLRAHTTSTGRSVGVSETNGIGFSTTDSQSFHWSLGTEVGTSANGNIGLSKLVSIGVGGHVNVSGSIGATYGHSETSSRDRTVGVSREETTTETDTTQVGGGESEGFDWSVSSTETISRSFGGHVIAGTYGTFYRQALRILRRAALVTYNQCGAPEVIGEVDFTDWMWAPDLALGQACPPLPKSNLPEAECLISPCEGE